MSIVKNSSIQQPQYITRAMDDTSGSSEGKLASVYAKLHSSVLPNTEASSGHASRQRADGSICIPTWKCQCRRTHCHPVVCPHLSAVHRSLHTISSIFSSFLEGIRSPVLNQFLMKSGHKLRTHCSASGEASACRPNIENNAGTCGSHLGLCCKQFRHRQAGHFDMHYKETIVLLDLPIFLASPTTMLSTPGGKPALRPSSARARAVSGVASAGFSITCNST